MLLLALQKRRYSERFSALFIPWWVNLPATASPGRAKKPLKTQVKRNRNARAKQAEKP